MANEYTNENPDYEFSVKTGWDCRGCGMSFDNEDERDVHEETAHNG